MWTSERQQREYQRRERIQLFDDFVDLALDGLITLDEAIIDYKEAVEEAKINDIAS